MPKVLLAGYMGCGNYGDDAIMRAFTEGIEAYGIEVKATSANPEDTFRNHRIQAVQRRDMRAVRDAIRDADALVFPGGSIFQDVSSAMSVYYYSTVVKMAAKLGKRVFLVGQGVGPLRSYLGRRWAGEALNLAHTITVRDGDSREALRVLGVKRPVKVTADTAFLLPPPKTQETDEQFAMGEMGTVGVAPRPLGKKVDVAAFWAEFCRVLYASGSIPALVPMDREMDGPLIQEISNRAGGKIPDLRKVHGPLEIQRRLARMESVIAMRLHAGILAATAGVAPLMVSYDPKVTAFARELNFGAPLEFDGLTPAKLLDAYKAHARARAHNQTLLMERLAAFRGAAQENVDLVAQALGRIPANR